MSRILGNHREVLAFQELHFFDELLPHASAEYVLDNNKAIKLFATLLATQRNGYFGSKNIDPFLKESSSVLNSETNIISAEVYKRFLSYETRKNGKIIPCEQTPQNIFAIKEILQFFPQSKIILMIRDPRAVLLSQKHKWKRRKLSGGKIPLLESVRSKINYHPETISRIWKSVMKTALLYKNNRNILFVKYEDLISDPESAIKNVCTHVGINFSPELLNIPIIGSSNFNDTDQKYGIDASKTDQWQAGGLSNSEIHICQTVTGDQMKLFGYEKIVVDAEIIPLTWYKISMPFRLGLALLLNLKRLKNSGDLIKRFLS